MDGQRLPALHNLLGWCPGPRAQVPWRETHPNPCLPSSLVRPQGPPLPYSACCSQGAAQTLGVMKKLPRDQSFPWDHLHFDFTITDGELPSVKNFQDLKRVSRQELLHICDCQHEAWSHRDTCWYKARKHTHTHRHAHTHTKDYWKCYQWEMCEASLSMSLYNRSRITPPTKSFSFQQRWMLQTFHFSMSRVPHSTCLF